MGVLAVQSWNIPEGGRTACLDHRLSYCVQRIYIPFVPH